MKSNSTTDREITQTRVFNTTPELLFKAWTSTEHLSYWFGPRGFSITTHEHHFKPGGVWRYMMHGPDGTDYANRQVFKEIVKNERIVYDHDADIPNDPALFHVTVTFKAQGNQTLLTMTSLFKDAETVAALKKFGAVEGGKQTLDRLDEYASTSFDDVAFHLTRTFDAPRELVWAAHSKREHLLKWWGPAGFKILDSSTLEFRGKTWKGADTGGTFHYGMQAPNGAVMWGKLTYLELVAPEKMVFIVSFSDANGGVTRHPMAPNWPLEVLHVATFTEKNGKTTIQSNGVPINATEEERQAYKAGHKGMTGGFKLSMDQLEAYLTSIKGNK